MDINLFSLIFLFALVISCRVFFSSLLNLAQVICLLLFCLLILFTYFVCWLHTVLIKIMEHLYVKAEAFEWPLVQIIQKWNVSFVDICTMIPIVVKIRKEIHSIFSFETTILTLFLFAVKRFLSVSIETKTKYHQEELAPAVAELARLEKQVQISYLNFMKDWNTTVAWLNASKCPKGRFLIHLVYFYGCGESCCRCCCCSVVFAIFYARTIPGILWISFIYVRRFEVKENIQGPLSYCSAPKRVTLLTPYCIQCVRKHSISHTRIPQFRSNSCRLYFLTF